IRHLNRWRDGRDNAIHTQAEATNMAVDQTKAPCRSYSTANGSLCVCPHTRQARREEGGGEGQRGLVGKEQIRGGGGGGARTGKGRGKKLQIRQLPVVCSTAR